jgi:hypothetical protein
MPFNPKSLLAILCCQTVPGKIAFGKTQVMYSVKQIGFAYAIASANAYNVFRKMKLLLAIILELENFYGLQKKTQVKGEI